MNQVQESNIQPQNQAEISLNTNSKPKHQLNLKVKAVLTNQKAPFYLFGDILKHSLFFVIFSLLNVFLPIFICLMAAYATPDGAYSTMGIGYVTSFQLAYSQIGFTFTIFASFYIYKVKNNKSELGSEKNLIYDILLIAFIYGLIITPLYVGPAYVYTKYANAHTNTMDSLEPAYNFIYGSVGFVLLTTIASSLIMNINYKLGMKHALPQVIVMFGLIILFSSTLALLTPLRDIGLGLGLTIGTALSVVITFLYNLFLTDTFKHHKPKISKRDMKHLIAFTWRPVIITLSIQILKGLALLSLNFQIPTELKNAVPLDFQMARIIWYNLMYLIPFIILGLADSVYFYFAKYPNQRFNPDVKLSIIYLFVFALVATVIVTIACNFIIEPLAKAYVHNQAHTYDDALIKEELNGIAKPKIIDYINNISQLTDAQKQQIIDFLSKPMKPIFSKPIIDSLAEALVKNVLVDKFTTLNATNITNLLVLPKSYAFVYLSIYCFMYPLGLLLNAARLSITDKRHPAILMIIAQTLAITFIVQFGITYQENNRFFLMDAWSFPLAVIGIIAFIYMSNMYFVAMGQWKFKTSQEQLNQQVQS